MGLHSSIDHTGLTGVPATLSFGSNSNSVAIANAPGASPSNSRADHVHLGVTSISHTSNAFTGPVTLVAGTSVAIVSPSSGTFEIISSATGGGGGAHAASHENGGADEIDVTGLVGAGGGGGGGTGGRYPVQEKLGGHSNVNSLAASFDTAPTDGNIIIMTIESEGTTNVTSIVQTNVTWTKLAESTASTAPHSEIWKGVVAAGAGTLCTVNWSGTAQCGWFASEWSGLAGTLDQSASVTNVASQYIPIITPTDAAALVVTGAAFSTFGGNFDVFSGPLLSRFTASALVAQTHGTAWGFPGIQSMYGLLVNPRSGTFSGVTISIV